LKRQYFRVWLIRLAPPNLRFKTDVSTDGPRAGAPAIVPAGMMGDRADVIFASPDEISPFIRHQC
jgi:cytochrome c